VKYGILDRTYCLWHRLIRYVFGL